MNNDFKKGGFRKKKIKFSQVSNEALRDNKLSLKAKGLYSLIQSYITIEDFTIYKSTLKNVCLEGEKAFESAWKELKDAGYLIQYRLQDPDTKTFYYEYDLLDDANIDLANEIHSSQNRKTKNEKAIPTKREVMDKRQYGQGGIYNNTDLNNTYSLYVSMYETHLIASKTIKDFIAGNYEKISLDLFEKILIETINNNRVSKKDAYFIKTLKALIKNNIETIEQYDVYIENYKSKKKSKGALKNSNLNKNNANKERSIYMCSTKIEYNGKLVDIENLSPDEFNKEIERRQKLKWD